MQFPLVPTIAARLLFRALVGTDKSGNHGHAGRIGKVGGSAGEAAIIRKMRSMFDTVATMGAEATPHFMLPDGTLLHHHSNIHEDAAETLGVTVEEMLQSGVIRLGVYSGVLHSADIGAPISDKQARILAEGSDPYVGLYIDVRRTTMGDTWDDTFSSERFADRNLNPDAIRNFVTKALVQHVKTLVGTDKSGNHGHAGRIGKVGGSAPALHGLDIAPVENTPEGGFLISTRQPTSKQIYEQAHELLETNLDLVLQDEAATKKAAEMMSDTDLLTTEQKKLPPKERVLAAVESMKENLRLLYEDYDPALADRAANWYFGAHRIAGEMAEQNGLKPHQAAAIIASLSPQMDWFQNVSLAERVVTITKKFDAENPVFSKELFNKFAEKWAPATEQKGRRAKPEGYHGTDAEWETHQKEVSFIRDSQMQAIKDSVGTHWSKLPPTTQAFMLRAYDESHNPRTYAVMNPEGDRLGNMMTGKGEARKIGWGAGNFIENAISITRDGSPGNINERLGGAPKVRSFYNNITDPWDTRSVTIDTHAIAAAYLKPLSGASKEVVFAMGGGKGNLPTNSKTGLKGTNAIVAQAYFDLAKELHIKPDRLQSMVWEAGRGLFRPEQKRSSEGRELALKTEKLWESYSKGKITRTELYGKLKDAAGGIAPPAWAGSKVSEQGRVVGRSVSTGRRDVSSGRRSASEHTGEFAWFNTGTERGRVFRGADDELNTLGGPGSGDHSHAGRPGQVGGSLPNVSGILATIHKPDGGFTYSPATGDSPTSGYAVSRPGNEEILDADDVNVVALAKYAKAHWDMLKESGNYMGAWHNPEDHKVYLDISTVVKTPEEAYQLAKSAHQIAFFDLGKGQSVTVEGGTHVIKTNTTSNGVGTQGTNVTGSTTTLESDYGKRSYTGGNQRSAGNSQSGNYGHSGRIGKVGGSVPNMANQLTKQLSTTDEPSSTKFLLPDGTRLATAQNHDAVVLEATKDADMDMKHRYNAAQDQGIVHVLGQWNGIEMRRPLTDAQAEKLAHDWNHTYKSSLDATFGPPWLDATGNVGIWNEEGVSRKFTLPFTANQLKVWSEEAAGKVRLLESQEETLLHTAADRYVERLKVAIRYAFARGRVAADVQQLDNAKSLVVADVAMSGSPYAVRDALEDLLPKILMQIVVDGAQAGMELLPEPRTAAKGNFGHAGRPGRVGGSAAAKIPDGVSVQRGEFDFNQLGNRRFMFNPRNGAIIFGMNGATYGDESHAEEFATAKKLGADGNYDQYLRGWVASPTLKANFSKTGAVSIYEQDGTYLPGGKDNSETAFLNASSLLAQRFIGAGATRNTVWAATMLTPEGPMHEHFPELFNKLRHLAVEIPLEPRTALKRTLPPKINLKFDDTNEAAIAWVKAHALELADGISQTARKRITEALVKNFQGGSRKDLRKTVLDAVGNEEDADLIARTETMKAASEGQRMMWNYAMQQGLLTGVEKRRWITTPDERTCPFCAPLDGKTARLNQDYPGIGLNGPPLHPRCRCTEGIVYS